MSTDQQPGPGGDQRPGSHPLFPIFLGLQGKLCTVVGGGEVAARKAASLLRAGALVQVVAPELGESMRALLSNRRLTHLAREYQPGDVRGSVLAFAATDSAEVNAAVSREAEALGIPVNAADDPAHCTFFVPATVQRDPICIAISTQGASPALARHLRERIEEAVPPIYQDLARLLGRLRPEVTATGSSPEERAERWRKVLESDVLSLLAAGRPGEAEALARRLLGLEGCWHESEVRSLHVVIGTRGSKLALAQARLVAGLLEQADASVEVKAIRTAGDASTQPRLDSATGLFVRDIEQALLRGEVDLAVHSLKDLPTGERPGLVLAAVPVRADPHDALASLTGAGLSELPPGSRVATSSARREAQLRAYRPDLVFVPVRGNVDTRLAKLDQGEFDALVVAYAGLLRLGLADRVAELISFDVCLPAPGQGALALQARQDDAAIRSLLAPLDHAPSRLAVTAERAFLARLGAGCSLPAGALGVVEGDRLSLKAVVAEPKGKVVIRRQAEGPAQEAEALGRSLGDEILQAGADRLLAEATC